MVDTEPQSMTTTTSFYTTRVRGMAAIQWLMHWFMFRKVTKCDLDVSDNYKMEHFGRR